VRIARFLGLAACAGAAVFVQPARALEEFKKRVIEYTGATCDPSCLLCHGSLLGGRGNFRIQPDGSTGFGRVLEQKYELIIGTEGTWTPALDANKVDHSDIDHDGMTDLDEIAIGRDPNDADPAKYLCGDGIQTGPEFGCARIAPARSADGVASTAAGISIIAGAFLLARRFRRKR
jgi:hypothetical protein